MGEERIRILKMLEEGEISVEEANQLLKAVGDSSEKKLVKKKMSSLKIMVSEGGDEKVNISLPLSLAKGLLRFIPRSAKESLEKEDLDLDQLIDSIESLDEPSDLVNIKDGQDTVIIRLE